MKGVIPAAGLGTRFLPATKNMPKEMLPVVDKPAIQYVIEEAVHAGVDDILIITGRGKEAIENHFDVAYELEDMLEKRNKEEWSEGEWVKYSGPHFDDKEYRAAIKVLLSEWLIFGENARQFEKEFPQLLGKRHGVLTNSGSSANRCSCQGSHH